MLMVSVLFFCTIHTLNTFSTRTAIVNSQEIPWCDCTKHIMVHKCVRGLWATSSILDSRITSGWWMLTDENKMQWILHWRRSRQSVTRLAQNVACLRHQHEMQTSCCLFLLVRTMNHEICNTLWSMTEFCEMVLSWGTGWRIDPTSVRFRWEVWLISADSNCLHER